MSNKHPIAVSLRSTSCDRYLYLLWITDFDDLVSQLNKNCYDFQCGWIDEFKVESNDSFDTLSWCSELHEMNRKNNAERFNQ